MTLLGEEKIFKALLDSLYSALKPLSTSPVTILWAQGQGLLAASCSSTKYLMNLVDSLLDVQQVTLGKLILVPKICQTDDLVQAAIDLLRVTAQDHRIALVTHTDLISVWADADCIVKVLTRLISNAITFSSANSTVWIVAEPINNLHVPGVQPAVRFQIRDQGQGITAPDLENIFEAFYQVDTSSSNDSGNGLSLAICRGMIEQHGGRIWIESQLGVALPFLSPYLPRSRKQQNQLA